MKTTNYLIMLLVVFIFSCSQDSNNANNNLKTIEKENIDTKKSQETKDLDKGETYKINAEKSQIRWSAKGVGHGHTGTIKIGKGRITIKNNVITDGRLKIDMNSITDTDLKDDKDNKKLVDHLKSKDFFDVANFPSAKAYFKEADGENVTFSLTIKDVTQDIKIPYVLMTDGENIIIETKFDIDRTKFGIKYNSKNFFKNLGDYMIEDEIHFDIKIVLD